MMDRYCHLSKANGSLHFPIVLSQIRLRIRCGVLDVRALMTLAIVLDHVVCAACLLIQINAQT